MRKFPGKNPKKVGPSTQKKDPQKNKAKAPGNQYPMGPRPGLFPKSRFHLAAKVHAYLAPKADACGCDHSKGGPVLLHYACNHVAISSDRIQHVTLKPQP